MTLGNGGHPRPRTRRQTVLQYRSARFGTAPTCKSRCGRRLLMRLVADGLLWAVRLGDVPPQAIMLHMPH